MSLLDTIGDLLKDAAVKLHINVLSGNDNSHSPKDTKNLKLIEKAKTKQTDKSSIKLVDKSKHIDKSVHNDNSVNYILQLPAHIQPNNLPSALKPLFDAYQQKQITYVAAERQEKLSDVLVFEQDSHVGGLLKFFKNKLSPHDFILLRTGLYIGHLRKNNPEEARKQWRYILDNNSKRDRRVINLAGANYFNTYFRPLYKELAKGTNANESFKKQFDDIIDDMHFVVFVGGEMSVGEVVGEVTEKATKNLRYGVKDDIIYIHAAGSSVQTAEQAITELRKTFLDIKIKRSTKSAQALIKASVYYRVNKLD